MAISCASEAKNLHYFLELSSKAVRKDGTPFSKTFEQANRQREIADIESLQARLSHVDPKSEIGLKIEEITKKMRSALSGDRLKNSYPYEARMRDLSAMYEQLAPLLIEGEITPLEGRTESKTGSDRFLEFIGEIENKLETEGDFLKTAQAFLQKKSGQKFLVATRTWLSLQVKRGTPYVFSREFGYLFTSAAYKGTEGILNDAVYDTDILSNAIPLLFSDPFDGIRYRALENMMKGLGPKGRNLKPEVLADLLVKITPKLIASLTAKVDPLDPEYRQCIQNVFYHNNSRDPIRNSEYRAALLSLIEKLPEAHKKVWLENLTSGWGLFAKTPFFMKHLFRNELFTSFFLLYDLGSIFEDLVTPQTRLTDLTTYILNKTFADYENPRRIDGRVCVQMANYQSVVRPLQHIGVAATMITVSLVASKILVALTSAPLVIGVVAGVVVLTQVHHGLFNLVLDSIFGSGDMHFVPLSDAEVLRRGIEIEEIPEYRHSSYWYTLIEKKWMCRR